MRTHLDLFSGIGGFALAAEWAGFTTTMFCEIDPFCQQVLAKHWPGTPIHDDIRTLTADIVGRSIELLTGGFPCQPFSVAGKQLGTADDRHLWPEMARVIDECRPRWVLGENTPGIIGLALDDCLADLESIGYEAWPVVIPACGVGAWHQRQRVWIIANATSDIRRSSGNEIGNALDRAGDCGSALIAHSEGAGRQPISGSIRADVEGQAIATNGDLVSFGGDQDAPDAERGGRWEPLRTDTTQGPLPPTIRAQGPFGIGPSGQDVADAISCGSTQSSWGVSYFQRWIEHSGQAIAPDTDQFRHLPSDNEVRPRWNSSIDGDWWVTESRFRGIPNGLSSGVDRRAARLKSLGNAIVPAVAFEILRLMKGMERCHGLVGFG